MADDPVGLVSMLEAYGIWGQIGVAAGVLIVLLALEKYGLSTLLSRITRATDATWDDNLLPPVMNRIYAFTILMVTEFTLWWVDNPTHMTYENYFAFSYILIITSVISAGIKEILPKLLQGFSKKDSVIVGGQFTLVVLGSRIATWLIGANFAFKQIGYDVTGFFASLAVFSLVFAIAAQQTLGNILNSSMLALDQPFDIGDRIEVDGVSGKVVSFGILSTKLLTLQEELIVIPNNTLVSQTITNYARGGGDGIATRLTLHIDFGVAYEENVAHVKHVVSDIARACPYVVDDPAPRTLMMNLGEYSKDFRLWAWIEDYTDEFVAKDWLLREMDRRFDAEGIIIPYPVAIELEKPQIAFETHEQRERMIRRKKARQHIAEIRQAQEELKFQEERESAREELEWLKAQLEQGNLKRVERETIESDIEALEGLLSRYAE